MPYFHVAHPRKKSADKAMALKQEIQVALAKESNQHLKDAYGALLHPIEGCALVDTRALRWRPIAQRLFNGLKILSASKDLYKPENFPTLDVKEAVELSETINSWGEEEASRLNDWEDSLHHEKLSADVHREVGV